MALFRCKMCGGALEINSETVATCEYCGIQQTLPKLDNNRKESLYDRANHFRRNKEFDKAMGIYELILNEDSEDAESYWSLILCKYGIEYVEDVSYRRIPTIHRAQFTSIFDDDNYKSALKYADDSQRQLYMEEAKVINEIQKGILAISQKEEPFDVFICYKQTDDEGKRTKDSVLANDIYHQLTQEGLKVFFAEITLEDKLGTEYEPYIFAALNSAKIMIVLGTKPEFFNAVWVKNEWGRYLALIKSGEKKTLVLAYKDMEPYDLPDELSHLQAQDMSKLGFMQDLIRGIKKITQSDIEELVVTKSAEGNDSISNIAPLLRRAFIFLEDGKFQDAEAYCERVLDMQPENAKAYLGKLMVEQRVRKQEELEKCEEPFTDSDNFNKIMRFGDKELIETIKGYCDSIHERKSNKLKEEYYIKVLELIELSNSEAEYKDAADKLDAIIDYKDAAKFKAECLEVAEWCRKEAIYANAQNLMEGQHYEDAIEKFRTIIDYRDVKQQISMIEEKILHEEKMNKIANGCVFIGLAIVLAIALGYMYLF